MKRFTLILLAVLLFGVPELGAQRFARCQSCTRDMRGRISRSVKAKKEFMRAHPCPVGAHLRVRPGRTHGSAPTCPGFQIDHVVPLACGGADRPENMQWLSLEKHRAKTKIDATCPR